MFAKFFSISINSKFFGIGLYIARIILISQNTCFEAIQNGGKSSQVLKASTDVSPQIIDGKEVQIYWRMCTVWVCHNEL